MKFIELLLFPSKPVLINLEDISYMTQNQRGHAVIVMRSGVDLEINSEYGNVLETILDECRNANPCECGSSYCNETKT